MLFLRWKELLNAFERVQRFPFFRLVMPVLVIGNGKTSRTSQLVIQCIPFAGIIFIVDWCSEILVFVPFSSKSHVHYGTEIGAFVGSSSMKYLVVKEQNVPKA